MGESTRPLPDLTAPLAPGRSRGIGSEVSSPLGAREPKGLRRRLRPLRPGFRVCSTTAHALRAPGKPGSSSISCNRSEGERSPVMLHAKRHPKWVPFCMELTSHQLGKIEPGNRFFRFSYVQPKQIWNHIIIYWIEVFYEIRFAIREPVTSLVRGHGK